MKHFKRINFIFLHLVVFNCTMSHRHCRLKTCRVEMVNYNRKLILKNVKNFFLTMKNSIKISFLNRDTFNIFNYVLFSLEFQNLIVDFLVVLLTHKHLVTLKAKFNFFKLSGSEFQLYNGQMSSF